MSLIFTLLDPKIIAFGAVAAGNINAQDAAKVAGIMIDSGDISDALAMDARIGRIISVDDILLVSSVKKLIPMVMLNTTNLGKDVANSEKNSPIC